MKPTAIIEDQLNPATHQSCCKNCRLRYLCLGSEFSESAIADFSAGIRQSRLFKPGEHIYRAGDDSKGLAVVSYGTVESYRLSAEGEEQVTGWYLPGDWLPMTNKGKNHTEFVKAVEAGRVCWLSWDALTAVSIKHPEVFQRFISASSKQLDMARAMMSDASAEARLASFLLGLANRYSELGFESSDVPLVMRKNRIARYLRLTPETLSRLLRRWRDSGVLEAANQRLFIQDEPELKALAVSA